ncbi:ADP-ribosylglycohydrolase [Achromatium sp. WMS3]|nr:ADP-ribosylglycohydrolase [Achromatium sp. WMS3]
MLLELAIGDAYGAGFEYENENLKYNDLSRYVKHPRHNIWPGRYTDDTQMSIAIAEFIISKEYWTPELLAEKFVEVFRRDPREGYSGKFYQLLKRTTSGKQLLVNINPESDKSGAAMRACPIGVFPTIKEVIEKCTVQAKITHNTTSGIAAANVAALMPHYFLYNYGSKEQLGQFLEEYVKGHSWSTPYRGKVKSKGWMSVCAAITAIVRNTTISEILKDCINFTGDVDTVATIALATASCCADIKQDIPDVLFWTLENKQYGKDYIIELDKKLMDK